MTTNGPDWGTPDDEALLEQARRNLERDRPRRDPLGIGLAIFFLVIAVVLFAVAVTFGGWWMLLWLPFSFFAFFGVFGLLEGMRKIRRDEGGRPRS